MKIPDLEPDTPVIDFWVLDGMIYKTSILFKQSTV